MQGNVLMVVVLMLNRITEDLAENLFSTLFYYVCQYGWQPNSGKRIAKGKGFIAKWNLKKADGEHLMGSRQTS